MIFLLKFVFYSLSKVCRMFSADCFIVDSQPRRAHYFAEQSIVGYTLLISFMFCSAFSSKFSPATAGNIYCNLSLFNLLKDDKKAADIFYTTDLKHKY